MIYSIEWFFTKSINLDVYLRRSILTKKRYGFKQ